ncbi:ATP-binding protein [Paenibacillus tarimensis]|uniref:ATP-binding protein n=1 Tax=Paenibacillus tarimensis TaxID=416012 RepID=UPI001F1FB366|nr:ATP-binding protein [Paenibacillus tarimensis]MCF2944194.1 ATP-binding protein [Paenibacillus tarimensis]
MVNTAYNLLASSALLIAYYLLADHALKPLILAPQHPWARAASGLMAGGLGALLMPLAIEIEPGALVDLHIVVIVLSAVYAGWPAALSCAVALVTGRLVFFPHDEGFYLLTAHLLSAAVLSSMAADLFCRRLVWLRWFLATTASVITGSLALYLKVPSLEQPAGVIAALSALAYPVGALLILLLESIRKSESKSSMLRRIVETSREGAVICDAEGRIMFRNASAREYFGEKLQVGSQMAAWAGMEIIGGRGPAISQALARFLSGSEAVLREQFTYQGPAGQSAGSAIHRHYELYAARKTNGISPAREHIFFFRDRSEEEHLQKIKDDMIGVVTHELKTPLTSIMGFAEMMLDEQLDQPRQRHYLETIHEEADKLNRLVHDYLDLRRMEEGQLVFRSEPVDVGYLLEDIICGWNDRTGRRIAWNPPQIDAIAYADPVKLMHAVNNLISNAIKYSPDTAAIRVACEVTLEAIGIHVADEGLGIPSDAYERLYDKFYRIDTVDRRHISGTGLGLSIVKEIADAHGGSISFTSEPGKGSTFVLALKRMKEDEDHTSITA